MPPFVDATNKIASAAKSGAVVLLRGLKKQEVDAVFLVPGAQVDPLTQSIAASPDLKMVVSNHELASGFMADGYARASSRPGVCLGIGACGAANMLPAAATAAIDDSGVMFITGNVSGKLKGHNAFQQGWEKGSADTEAFANFVRYSATAGSGKALQQQIDKALECISQPFRTPVHVSIPYDVQGGHETGAAPSSIELKKSGPVNAQVTSIEQITDTLAAAKFPILLVGPRFTGAGSHDLLRTFAETFCIPVATTLSAKGVLPENHVLSLGNFGFGGSRRAIESIIDGNSDLIVLLGADFNERDSLCWDERVKPRGRRVIRIDSKQVPTLGIDVDEYSSLDCVATVRDWVEATKNRRRNSQMAPLLQSSPPRESWVRALTQAPHTYGSSSDPGDEGVVPLEVVVTSLRKHSTDDTNLVVDAGLHRVFAGHYWEARRPGSFFAACGTAPLGWAICASVGIQMARTDESVFVLTGDGCMRTHGTELATMVRYGLPILVVVCNNSGYASIHRRMSNFSHVDEIAALPPVDWVAFANSLGARGTRVTSETALKESIVEFFERNASSASPQGPYVLEVATPLQQSIPHSDLLFGSLDTFASSSIGG